MSAEILICVTTLKLTFHRHQMRAAKIIRPKTKLMTMMKTFTKVEGLWLKRASTTTWKSTT